MNSIRTSVVLTACGLCWFASASAQAPAPTNGSATNPSAASTEGQRGVLRNGNPNSEQAPAPESGTSSSPSAASSPHQRDVTGGSAKTKGGMSVRSFVTKASQDGMTEVKLADLANQKSQNDAVKNFASHMASDHSTANSELESLAKQENIRVSDKLDAKHQAQVTALSKKSGAAFDKAYTSAMVKAHKQAIALFKAGTHSSDQDVASFANKTLPTLESHQRMADDLASQMRVASADSSSSKR